MQTELPKIQNWCLKNRLVLNTDKTFQVIFKDPRKKINLYNYQLQMNNKSLPIQSNAKFLGVYLDENLTYQEQLPPLE